MRSVGLMILAAALTALTGCAAQNTAPVAYQHASAGALAFDPPILAGTARVDLSRDGRQNGAFAGFADTTTTFYYLSVENNQGGRGDSLGGGDRYQRDSFSETYGVNYR